MENKSTEQLREEAFAALLEAERKMHAYFASCDIGREREKAYDIYENIRLAAMVGR